MSVIRFLFGAIRNTGTKEIPISPALMEGKLDSILDPTSPEYEIVQEFWRHHKHTGISPQNFSIRLPKSGNSFPLEIIGSLPLSNFFIGNYTKLLDKFRIRCGVADRGVWFYQVPNTCWGESPEPSIKLNKKEPTMPINPSTWPPLDDVEHISTHWRLVTSGCTTQMLNSGPNYGEQIGFEGMPEGFSMPPAICKDTRDKGTAMPIISDLPSSVVPGASLEEAPTEHLAEVTRDSLMIYPLGRHVGFVIPSERVKYIESVCEEPGGVSIVFNDGGKITVKVNSEKYNFSRAINALNREKKKYK